MYRFSKNNNYLLHRVKMFSKYYFILWILVSSTINISAQVNDSIPIANSNQQIWIDIFPHYYMNEKLEYYGDGGYRIIVDKESRSRIYARPSLKYHLNPRWTVHAGLGLFYCSRNISVGSN